MLQSNNEHLISTGRAELAQSASLGKVVDSALGLLRRQYWVILLALPVSMTLAVVYLKIALPSFTASASMMIDPRATTRGSQPLQAVLGDAPVDWSWIETQIVTLKSDKLASSVIKKLHLTEDSEFVGEGMIHRIFAAISKNFLHSGEAAKQKSDEDLMRRALFAFGKKLDIQRVGMSYIVEIDFKSQNPDRAAQIANAVAEAYIEDQLDAKYQADQRANDWLQQRLQTLRQQASAAAQAVVEFKRNHNLVEAGGKLVNEQQLTDLNSQLVVARAQTTEAQAKLSRIEAVLRAAQPADAANASDTLIQNLEPERAAGLTVTYANNPVMTTLRSRYLELVNREADWSKRYGHNHLAVVNLRSQIQDIRHSIVDELKHTAESYKSNYAIAKRGQEDLEKRLADSVAESQGANAAQVLLRGLESSAQSYRTLYDNFLQHYTEAVQQQSFPVTEARLISPASSPLEAPSHMLRVLGLALFGGIGGGAGLGLLRELLDRVFRTSGQVQSVLDTECLALVPSTQVPMIKPGAKAAPSNIRAARGRVAARIIAPNPSLLRYVIDSPLSAFAESIRAVKVGVDLSGSAKSNKIIGITSSLPNEGKSTIAASLAQLSADAGARVILVDCDLRKPSLTPELAPNATAGLIEVITNTANFDEVIWSDPSTPLSFLPVVVRSRLNHSSEILASEAMKRLFVRLRESYDYVIVDLPPLAPLVDVRSATHLLDCYVFVVAWGQTKIGVVEHALATARGVYDNLLGVVLNKVDLKALRRYEGHGNYNRYYARYGYTD
jgi:polysaccharide biosynthesis transport protein